MPSIVSICAFSKGCGLCRHVPSIQKVTMEPVASRVTVGKDESSTIRLVNVIDTVENFEEEMDQLDWVLGRADTIINLAHVIDMSIVVEVQIDSIPAGRKLNLRAQAVRTVRAEHVRLLCLRGRTKTVKACTVRNRSACNSGVVECHRGVVVRALEWRSGNHLETLGKGDNIFAVVAST